MKKVTKSDRLVKKKSQTCEKSDKKSRTSEKISQTCEKSHQKWQISEKKVTKYVNLSGKLQQLN